jgi:lysophospholipase L1-like esterase
MKDKDYTFRGFLLTLTVVVGVALLALVPPFELFGMQFSRVNIFDSILGEEQVVEYSADIERLEQELATLEPQVEVVEAEEVVTLPSVRKEWIYKAESAHSRRVPRSSEVLPDTSRRVVAIEDFDTLDFSRFDRFVDKLATGEGVRVAFLGDSFVEGDILTSDLRAELQQIFGGRGVGFVACDIPFATVRRTVHRTSSGWSAYSVMKPKAAPEELRDKFFVSGYMARGSVGATTRWEVTDAFETLDSLSRARVLLFSDKGSSVEVALNDSLSYVVELEADNRLREIYVEAPVDELTVKVVGGEVLCYGVSLEGDKGVMIDNFSVRSNNGHAIFGTGAHINRQMDELLGYDLVVLQYGLNIMQAERRNYSKYRDLLRDMISYAERCFPQAAILVLGVSDRWVKDAEGEGYKPIGTVDALAEYQRAAADSCGAAFWNTAEAMAELGGMPMFVERGWAANDYTHINFRGGRAVAEALAAAIRMPVYELLAEREEAARLEVERKAREAWEREQARLAQIEAQVEAMSAIIDSLDIDTWSRTPQNNEEE